MTEDAGTDQRGGRRPDIKSFVRNLDVLDTEGKDVPEGVEFTASPNFSVGPSWDKSDRDH